MIKQNDWLAANINNPGYDVGDFKAVGLDTDNTQLLSEEEYKNKSLIKKRFTKDDGEFDDEKFHEFYENMAQLYNVLDDSERMFKYDPFDYSRFYKPKEKQIVDYPEFNMFRMSNPTGITKSKAGINIFTEPEFSSREWAQKSKVFNRETGEFEDYSPNDHALVVNPIEWFHDWIKDPLVLATYDEDTIDEDPISGQTVEHKKGDIKLNSEGKPYYETLNGRNPGNKQFLSTFDVLTVDGEGFNRYDYFDADGLDKNVAGTIGLAAAKILPLFIPVAGEIYAGVQVGLELLRALPMLDGVVGAITGNNNDSLFTGITNTLAGKATQFKNSTSDYAQQNMISFEGLGNLVADVATQWGQQKLVAKGIGKLKGISNYKGKALIQAEKTYMKEAPKMEEAIRKEAQAAISAAKTTTEKQTLTSELENMLKTRVGTAETWKDSELGKSLITQFELGEALKAQKAITLGQDASLAYMAVSSNSDLYQDMLEQGLSKREATLVTLGSTVGMFLVDKYSGLGKIFFDEETAASRYAMRVGFKEMAKKWQPIFANIKNDVKLTKAEKIKRFFQEGKELGRKTTKNFIDDLQYHTLSGMGKAVAEGIEEVSEEVVADLSKQIYEFGRDLGFDTTTDNVEAFDDIVNDPTKIKNLLARYGMNFLGGVIGGGIFYAKENFLGNKREFNSIDSRIEYLVRNNKTQDLLNYLDKQHKKGSFGSTSLSATPLTDSSGNPIITEDGKLTYGTAKKGEETQNDFIYNRLKEMVLQVDGLIKEYGLNASENDLYKTLTFNEERFEALQDFLEESSYDSNYYETYQDLVTKFIDVEQQIRSLKAPDVKSSDEYKKFEEKMSKLVQQRDNLLQDIQEFRSGETSMKYLRAMLMSIDPRINPKFTKQSFETWLKTEHFRDVNSLTDGEFQFFKKMYLQDVKPMRKWDLLDKYNEFINVEKKVLPELLTLQQETQEFKKWHDEIEKLFSSESPFNSIQTLTADSLLDGETEESEDYIFRNSLKEGETQEQFNFRRQARENLASHQQRQITVQALNKALDMLKSGKFIDVNTRRRLLLGIQTTQKQILHNLRAQVPEGYIPIAYDSEITKIIDELKPDLSNYDNVKQNLNQYIESYYKNIISENATERDGIFQTLSDSIRDIYNEEHPDALLSENLSKDQIITALSELINPGLSYSELTKEQFVNSEFFNRLKDSLINKGFKENIANKLISQVKDYISQGQGIELEDDLKNFIIDGNSINYIDLTSKDDENIDYSLVQDLLNTQKLGVQQRLDELVNKIESDPYWNFIQEVQNLPQGNNPIVNIVKKIGLALNKDFGNVESLLQKLYDRAVEGDMNSFILTTEEQEAINEAEDVLTRALGYIFATYNDVNHRNPFPHNSVLNLIAKKHKIKDWEDLPELDIESANIYTSEIMNYLYEIGQRDGDQWTIGSWRYWSNMNDSNRIQKFINAEHQYAHIKLLMFDAERDNFKGDDFDLLEGYEKIENTTNERIKLHKIEDLFYNNVHRLLQERHISFDELLSKTNIHKIFKNKFQIIEQNTSSIKDGMSPELSEMSKAMYILSIAGISSTNYYSFLEKEIPKHNAAPIVTQKDANRTALAMINSLRNNDDIWKSGLRYFYELSESSAIFMSNIVTVFGNGGSGKTFVCAKTLRDFIEDKEDSVWILAPGTDQLNNLKKNVSNSKSYLVKDAIDVILSGGKFKEEKVEGGFVADVISENVTAKINNLPKCIIIDEVTHVSSEDLQRLHNLAKQHNIAIIGLGDDLQNGYDKSTNKKVISNIGDPTMFFCGRTGRLGMTLRENNGQKTDNINLLSLLTDYCVHIQSSLIIGDEKRKDSIRNVGQAIHNIQFKYFLGDVLNGEVVTKSITSEMFEVLKKAKEDGKSIVFVGNQSSAFYNQLKDLEVDVKQEFDIQGSEYDYVIVDKDWKLTESKDSEINHQNYIQFLQSLYTLTTRSREGTILIDNGLTDIIKPSEKNSIKSSILPFSQKAIDDFKKSELDFIKELNLQPAEEEHLVQERTGDLIQDANDIIDKMNNTSDEDEWNELNEELNKIKDNIIRQGLNSSTLHKLNPFTKPDSIDDIELDEPDDKPIAIVTEISTSDVDEIFEWTAWSNTHLLGVPREEIEPGVYRWKLNSGVENPNYVLKEVQALADDFGDIEDAQDKYDLVQRLLNFKSTLLFEHKYNSDVVPLSKDEFDNIKYHLVVSRQLNDTFVGMSSLDDEKSLIRTNNGEAYVFRLVASFQRNGRNCEVTLAMLSNPEEADKKSEIIIKNRDEIINNLEEQISLHPELESKKRPVIDKMKKFQDEIRDGSYVRKYKDFLSKFVEKFPENQSEIRQEIKRENLIFGKTCDIKNTNSKTVRAYRKANPHKVISDVCFYRTGDSEESRNSTLRGNVRQRAVIFETADTTLSASDLPQIWADEQSRNDGQHTVRMIILRNRGVTFSDLTQNKRAYTVQTEANVWSRVPHETKPMSYRMLVGLWNFRADLYNFLDELDRQGIDSSIDTRLEEYAKAVKINLDSITDPNITKAEKVELAVEKTLNEHPEFKDIEKINDGLRNLRRFRLGRSSVNEYIVRKINDKTAYPEEKGSVYGLYITYNQAIKLKQSVDSIFSLLGDVIKITKNGSQVPISERLGDKKGRIPWVINKDNREKLNFTMDGVKFDFPQVNSIRYLPILLTKLYGRAGVYADLDDKNDFNFEKSRTFTYTLGKDTEKHVLDLKPLIQQGSDLQDMLNLCMFGTTGDIHSDIPRNTDAYFINGMYIDPMSYYGSQPLAEYKGGEFVTVGNADHCFLIDTEVRMPRIFFKRDGKYNVKPNKSDESIIKNEPPQKQQLTINNLPSDTTKYSNIFVGDKSLDSIISEFNLKSSDVIETEKINKIIQIKFADNISIIIDPEIKTYAYIGIQNEDSEKIKNIINLARIELNNEALTIDEIEKNGEIINNEMFIRSELINELDNELRNLDNSDLQTFVDSLDGYLQSYLEMSSLLDSYKEINKCQ